MPNSCRDHPCCINGRYCDRGDKSEGNRSSLSLPPIQWRRKSSDDSGLHVVPTWNQQVRIMFMPSAYEFYSRADMLCANMIKVGQNCCVDTSKERGGGLGVGVSTRKGPGMLFV